MNNIFKALDRVGISLKHGQWIPYIAQWYLLQPLEWAQGVAKAYEQLHRFSENVQVCRAIHQNVRIALKTIRDFLVRIIAYEAGVHSRKDVDKALRGAFGKTLDFKTKSQIMLSFHHVLDAAETDAVFKSRASRRVRAKKKTVLRLEHLIPCVSLDSVWIL